MPEPLRVESYEALTPLVAEHVMGWKVCDNGEVMVPMPGGGACSMPWNPWRSIGDAWDVVERMRAEGWLAVVKVLPPGFPFVAQGSTSELAPSEDIPIPGTEGRAYAEFHWMRRDGEWRPRKHALADTAPLAIALAALQALGVEVELSLPEAEERQRKERR